MILSEKEIKEHKIISKVGRSIPVNFKKLKPIGGSGVFLKKFVSRNKTGGESLKINSKCNFEKRTQGIIIHINSSNTYRLILIPHKNIEQISIIKGREVINPLFPSLMWVLLKLNVSLRIARYFPLRTREYSIEQMELNLRTKNYEIHFLTSGYNFENQLEFLQSLSINEKLHIIEK